MAQLDTVVNTSYRFYCVEKIGTFQREALQELSLPCRYMNKIYNAPLCSFYSMCTTSNLMNDDFPVLDKKTAICENKVIS